MKIALFFGTFSLACALTLPALPLVAGGGPENDVSNFLINITWRWERTLMNNDAVISPEDPSRYTITFRNDGTVTARVDCNQMAGTYRLDGASILIHLTHGTRAMCSPKSLDVEFQRQIGDARQLVFTDEHLYSDLAHHRGTMRLGHCPKSSSHC